MQQDKISVIIPVHNTKDYLGKCMDCVLGQTYENIEVILVDDGSTDGSGELCEAYAIADKRVKVYHKQKSGVGGGRNTGIDHATGVFISFVDSDDTMDPDYLEVMINAQRHTDADIVCVGIWRVWEQEKKTVEVKYPANIYNSSAETLLAMGKGLLEEGAWAKLYRATVFETLRFPENRVHEDVLTTHRAFCRAQRVVQLPECKYYYLQRPGSIMHGETNAELHFGAFLERYEDICRIVSKRNLPEEIQMEFFKRTMGHCYNAAYMGFWRKQGKAVKNLRKYWRSHRKEICSLGIRFRCKAYFPYLSAVISVIFRLMRRGAFRLRL